MRLRLLRRIGVIFNVGSKVRFQWWSKISSEVQVRLHLPVLWRIQLQFRLLAQDLRIDTMCLWILCSAIWARRLAHLVLLAKGFSVCVNYCHHLCVPRKLQSSVPHFLYLGVRFVDLIFWFIYFSTRKPPLGLSSHMERKANVGLF